MATVAVSPQPFRHQATKSIPSSPPKDPILAETTWAAHPLPVNLIQTSRARKRPSRWPIRTSRRPIRTSISSRLPRPMRLPLRLYRTSSFDRQLFRRECLQHRLIRSPRHSPAMVTKCRRRQRIKTAGWARRRILTRKI